MQSERSHPVFTFEKLLPLGHATYDVRGGYAAAFMETVEDGGFKDLSMGAFVGGAQFVLILDIFGVGNAWF